MRRVHRWMLFVIFVLVLVVGALSSLAVTTVRSSYPRTDGELTLAGLNAEVEVVRDAYGVPNIYADSATDLFAAQGYVHAQDRFWEMDFRRHVTAGRLSELFGASQVGTDTTIRTMGWRRVAEQELKLLSPSTRRYLDAYADGVNAYLDQHSVTTLSMEYNVLGLTGLNYDPADWTAVDSISWLKAMAWDLSGNQHAELERALLAGDFSADQIAELFPPQQHDRFEPIVTRGGVQGGRFQPGAGRGSARPAPVLDAVAPADRDEVQDAMAGVARAWRTVPRLVGDTASGGIGSNSWAMSGERTASGAAMLSNDPHLATSIPSVFSQVGLHCRDVGPGCPFDVSGFSFAGMPGVIIGHNADIAWGLTTSYVDVQDLYLEQIRGDRVRVGNRWTELESRTEEIRVKGESEPRTITVRSSRHGPLMSDVDERAGRVAQRRETEAGESGDTEYAVALAWTALTPRNTMDAVFALNRAENFDDFRDAAKLLASPSQNLLYADREGNIGYQLPGDIPVRGRGDGRLPVPGWDRRFDWQQMIDFDQLPYDYNPPSGYIVAANQSVVSDYPRPLTAGESHGWRSQQLVDDINAGEVIDLDTAESFFYDDHVRYAEDLLPPLLKVEVADAWVAEGQRVLQDWDRRAGTDSAGAAYFNVVLRNLLQETFDDQLPSELQPSSGDRWYAVLARLMKHPNSHWWDDTGTDEVETRDDIVLRSMQMARKQLTAMISEDPAGWQWGKLHRVTLRHQAFGEVPAVGRLVNRGDHPVSGGNAVVNAMGFSDRDGFGVTSGPAMRMLINWDDLDTSRWINQSGNSGHAFHRNYDDQLPLWARNETLPFRYSREAVVEAGTDTLTLQPRR